VVVEREMSPSKKPAKKAVKKPAAKKAPAKKPAPKKPAPKAQAKPAAKPAAKVVVKAASPKPVPKPPPRTLPPIARPNRTPAARPAPLIGIIMGSRTDLDTLAAATELLDAMAIPYEMRILSAHRTPDETAAWAKGAEARGLEVIIAAAGGAAHLAGVIAATTPVPVIGVPVALANLDGMDSLLSMVQMPKGIPVATVAVNGARNAALLAIRIMALADPRLAAELDSYIADLADQVRDMDAEVVARYQQG
jgi:5-(carboxyamino)imidazole ribonucleotide mutase